MAQRLTLAQVDRFRDEGALVVLFALAGLSVAIPPADDGTGRLCPLTDGGARQWIVTHNVPFGTEMMLFEVMPSENGPVWHYITPLLNDPSYHQRVLRRRAEFGGKVPLDENDFEAILDRQRDP